MPRTDFGNASDKARFQDHEGTRNLLQKRKIHNLRRVPSGGAPARSAQTRGYAHGYEEYKGASRRKDRNGGNCAIANVPVAKAAGGCYNEHRTQNGYNVKR